MIGILGGTFDPVHLGHLRLALDLLDKNSLSPHKLSEIRFIPCKNPVLKKSASASSQHRLAMLKLAVKNQPNFSIDDRELRRKTPSYMIDTLCELQTEMPEERFALIMGSDALSLFTQWQCYEDILEIAELVIIPRGTLATLPISSSHIRALLKSGKSARYLVPDKVLDYIIKHKMYSLN